MVMRDRFIARWYLGGETGEFGINLGLQFRRQLGVVVEVVSSRGTVLVDIAGLSWVCLLCFSLTLGFLFGGLFVSLGLVCGILGLLGFAGGLLLVGLFGGFQ